MPVAVTSVFTVAAPAGSMDSPLVTRERLRALGAGYGLGLAGAVLALVLTLLAFQLVVAFVPSLSVSGRLLVLFVAGQYVPFLGVPLLYLRRRGLDWDDIREYLGVRVPTLREFGVVAVGFLLVLVLTYGSILLVVEVLGLEPASNQAGEVAKELPRLVPLLVVGSLLVIGPCEETLFRGLVQNRIREAYSAPAAILLSTALFAAVHVTALTGSASARAVTVVILFVPGLVFGAAYEYTDNLVVSALIHGVWDAFIFTSIYIATVYGPEAAAA